MYVVYTHWRQCQHHTLETNLTPAKNKESHKLTTAGTRKKIQL